MSELSQYLVAHPWKSVFIILVLCFLARESMGGLFKTSDIVDRLNEIKQLLKDKSK